MISNDHFRPKASVTSDARLYVFKLDDAYDEKFRCSLRVFRPKSNGLQFEHCVHTCCAFTLRGGRTRAKPCRYPRDISRRVRTALLAYDLNADDHIKNDPVVNRRVRTSEIVMPIDKRTASGANIYHARWNNTDKWGNFG